MEPKKFNMGPFVVTVTPFKGPQSIYSRYVISYDGTFLGEQMSQPDFEQCVDCLVYPRDGSKLTPAIKRHALKAVTDYREENAQTVYGGIYRVVTRSVNLRGKAGDEKKQIETSNRSQARAVYDGHCDVLGDPSTEFNEVRFLEWDPATSNYECIELRRVK